VQAGRLAVSHGGQFRRGDGRHRGVEAVMLKFDNLRLPTAPPAWLEDVVAGSAERAEAETLLWALVGAMLRQETLPTAVVDALLQRVSARERDAVVSALEGHGLLDKGWVDEWFGRGPGPAE
jgi:hypothetical protein